MLLPACDTQLTHHFVPVDEELLVAADVAVLQLLERVGLGDGVKEGDSVVKVQNKK